MSASPALPAIDSARRGSLSSALWTLYALTLRQHLHGKRWLVMALLFLLPAGLAVLVRITAPRAPVAMLEFTLPFMFIPQGVLPLVALIYASGIIRDEQEEQTITYLLIRPVPKWAIYVVKLLATITTTVLLTIVFTVFTYAAIFVGGDISIAEIVPRCVKAASIHSLAMIAYCSLFGLFSLLMKRVLIAGIVYIVVVEGLLANLPFGIRLLTVIYYTRVIAYRTMQFFVDMPDGRQEDVAAAAWQLSMQSADPNLIGDPQIPTAVTTLFAASVVCTAIAAFMCARREFYVKTPETG
jgi:ABC-2 type transport system permease protein